MTKIEEVRIAEHINPGTGSGFVFAAHPQSLFMSRACTWPLWTMTRPYLLARDCHDVGSSKKLSRTGIDLIQIKSKSNPNQIH